MSEEKKGAAKITFEIELNEDLMNLLKETLTRMPEVVKVLKKKE